VPTSLRGKSYWWLNRHTRNVGQQTWTLQHLGIRLRSAATIFPKNRPVACQYRLGQVAVQRWNRGNVWLDYVASCRIGSGTRRIGGAPPLPEEGADRRSSELQVRNSNKYSVAGTVSARPWPMSEQSNHDRGASASGALPDEHTASHVTNRPEQSWASTAQGDRDTIDREVKRIWRDYGTMPRLRCVWQGRQRRIVRSPPRGR
jgi:hypothetical protein